MVHYFRAHVSKNFLDIYISSSHVPYLCCQNYSFGGHFVGVLSFILYRFCMDLTPSVGGDSSLIRSCQRIYQEVTNHLLPSTRAGSKSSGRLVHIYVKSTVLWVINDCDIFTYKVNNSRQGLVKGIGNLFFIKPAFLYGV